MSSLMDGSRVGASIQARELSKRRVTTTTSSPTTLQTPTTPVTPVAPITPMLTTHLFTDGNMMEDLQLAAELGKTLLERNKDLESTIRELRSVTDDKTQEIEYLSKQTAALREVNDSRLRIYEQLEVSIQDLEKSNQRLTAETAADKRKIRSLSGTVEQLESKCEELHKCLEEARITQQQRQKENEERGRTARRRSFLPEDNTLRRSLSCENANQSFDDILLESSEMRTKMANLQEELLLSQRQAKVETKKKEELEIEISCVVQENAALREQMLVLKERETNTKSFEDELASLDDTTSGKFCRKCMGMLDETGSNLTVQDFVDDIEEIDSSMDNIQGECALVKLRNGGYAWGSQESLASMGQVVNCVGSNSISPQTEGSDAPHNSLLSELDAQYRILIEKYEALVEARERSQDQEMKRCFDAPHTLVDSGIDELSGPMSIVMTEIPPPPPEEHSVNVGRRCQRCTTCSCDLKPSPRPKSNILEDLSEVETSSSGFSEGEGRLCSKMTQTEIYNVLNQFCNEQLQNMATTPTPSGSSMRYLNLGASPNPCNERFDSKPEYRKLFHEIFEVLKNEVHKNQTMKSVKTSVMPIQDFTDGSCNGEVDDDTDSTAKCSEVYLQKQITKKDKRKQVTKEKTKTICKINEKEIDEPKQELCKPDKMKDKAKPPRPDFLDLETSSSCSSRSRRRKKPNRYHQQGAEHQQSGSLRPTSQPEQHDHSNIHASPRQSKEVSQKDVSTKQETTDIASATQEQASKDHTLEPQHKDGPVTRESRSTSNSSRRRCEHKSKRSKHKQPALQNKHLNNVLAHHPPSHHHKRNNAWSNSNAGATNSATLPSVQVARLIKFEKSYAEVLKSKPK